MNHLRKGHNLIGHPFGRNLHKSNMAATVSHENAYVVHLCIETCNSVGLYYMIIQIILNVKAWLIKALMGILLKNKMAAIVEYGFCVVVAETMQSI